MSKYKNYRLQKGKSLQLKVDSIVKTQSLPKEVVIKLIKAKGALVKVNRGELHFELKKK